WCARPIYGSSFHIRSAESVAREMRELKDVYGAEHLWFADDLFSIKPRWIIDLAQAVEALGAALPFKMQSRINLMTPETASALGRAGCVEVWMGVESGSQKVLDLMDKGTRVEDVYLAREHLRRQGIRACFFLQLGYPGETWEDILQTIRLVRETRPDDVGVSVSYPLPGTKFYEQVREELGAKTNWVDSDDLAMMFRGAYAGEFYRALRDALHAEVETWSPPSSNVFCLKTEGAEESLADPPRLGELWTKVHELEKTCRTSEPTFPPAAAASLATLAGGS
ncbi:MAG TPA: radical SAM protein, partial [Terriglobia bacterium]|nr:radical SAM protein [Terriglobia bacterium]